MSTDNWPVTQADICLSQADFDRFARLSGDDNPIHTNVAFAETTVFGATVAHGMLLFTQLRGVLERHYPRAVLIRQELMFANPAYADEALHLTLTPGVREGNLLTLMAVITKPSGTCCLQGECQLMLADIKP